MATAQQIQAAEELLRRRSLRSSFTKFAQACGFEPAEHHRLVIEKLEAVERGEIKKLMIFMPPGSAKSTYTSKLFPPWYLARQAKRSILACSYSATLAETFGKSSRNFVDQHEIALNMSLRKDSKAADKWETSNNGLYFCAGVGAGIAGHRADLGLIDDPIGSQEDADSKLIRDKQWAWYVSDFLPRLRPGASQILIQNRRHEEDLAGRLLAQEGSDWTVISIPLIAEDNDILGRAKGVRLWPEYFNDDIEKTARMNSRTFAALYQQRPAPEQGAVFQRPWLRSYAPAELPTDLRIYVASDHAVSLSQSSDRTCLLPIGVDEHGTVWVLPDIFWKQAGPSEVVESMIALAKRRKPLIWWAEKGHISMSIAPFLEKRKREENCFFYIEEVNPKKDKLTRAQSIIGRMSMLDVRFPTFASWWSEAETEILNFPSGKHDDFVDALAHIGMGLDRMTSAVAKRAEHSLAGMEVPTLTMAWLKQSVKLTALQKQIFERGF